MNNLDKNTLNVKNNDSSILDNFLFEIKDQVLTISCSDLESTITSNLKIDAKSEGSIAIPAKILIDILKTFPRCARPFPFVKSFCNCF